MSKDVNTKNKSEKVVADKRSTTLKLFSIASSLVLIAIIVLVNIIFSALLGDVMTFDFSSTGQNSISQITKDFLETLPADAHIRIVGLMDEPTNIKDTPYEYIVPLLNDYASESNGRVTVEYMNPSIYPSIMSELDPQGMYDLVSDEYVVSYNGRVQVIHPLNCFTYDPQAMSYGYYLPTGNNAEAVFTNAIRNLTQGYQKKAYFVTGLQESGHQQLSAMLEGMSIESADLMASDSFDVPADCDLLIISGINTDISERMAEQIKLYLNERGGKLIVAVDYTNNVNEGYTNLNSVLNFMNLNIDAELIQENGVGNKLTDNGFESLANVEAAYTDYAPSSTLRIAYSRPVRAYDNPYSYISTSEVLTTSDNASANIVDPTSGYITHFANEGKYNVAMYSTFESMKNPPEVYAFGTMNFTSDSYISNYGFNDSNVTFMRNIIRSMVKIEESSIVVSKPLADYNLDTEKVTADDASKIIFVFMVIVPLALVICGTVVYNKRKNL